MNNPKTHWLKTMTTHICSLVFGQGSVSTTCIWSTFYSFEAGVTSRLGAQVIWRPAYPHIWWLWGGWVQLHMASVCGSLASSQNDRCVRRTSIQTERESEPEPEPEPDRGRRYYHFLKSVTLEVSQCHFKIIFWICNMQICI